MAHTSSPDLATLYATLGQLRLALPLVLLGLVAARWAAKALLGMMDRIQSAGWQVEDDVYGPPERDEAAERRKRDRGGDEEDEDDVTPVVTKSKTVRRGLVLGTTGLVAFSYFGDGVAQGAILSSRDESDRADIRSAAAPSHSQQSSPRSSPRAIRLTIRCTKI